MAEDGRNITIEFGTLTPVETGLNGDTAAATTFVGSYSLYTRDGSEITVDSQVGGTLANSGLSLGTFAPDTATFVTNARVVADNAAPTGAGTDSGLLNGDTLVINDITIEAGLAADDNASYVDPTGAGAVSSLKSASAIAIAAAINKKSDLTGVTATAASNVLRGSGFTAATVGAVYINGVTLTTSLDANSDRDDVITAINQVAGQTGVVASRWGDGVELIAEDGRNITISSDGTADALGLTGVTIGGTGDDSDTVTHYSEVVLTSDKEFTLKSGSEGNANFESLGFVRGTLGGTNNGQKVADIDVTTVTGATEAIVALDAAIQNVGAAQSKSGAIQNRLESAVSVLSESQENISASRSRILDTDYATETTAMAKAQIVQQAATAMLAQANQQSQSVLALLQ